MRCEISVSELLESEDWEGAFGEDGGGNTTPEVESMDGTSISRCPRSQVESVIAAVNGENDLSDWLGVFKMRDGRFLAVVAECDYTGWD